MAMIIYESPQQQYTEVLPNGSAGRQLPGVPQSQYGYTRIPVPGGGALWVESVQQQQPTGYPQQYLPAPPQEIRLVYEQEQKGLWNSMTRGEKLATGLGIAAAAGAGIAVAIAVANANSGGGCDLHSQVASCLNTDWDINVD